MLKDTFNDQYEWFKKDHGRNFSHSILLQGNYLVDNEYPIGEGDKTQFFRAIGCDIDVRLVDSEVHP